MGRPKTVSTNIEDRKRRKRELEQKRYQKIKGDPVLYAQYQLKNKAKYEKRKAQKKVISIKDMTPRSRRVQRKKWREAFNAYYQRKKDAKAIAVAFMALHSPPDSEVEDNNELRLQMSASNRYSPSILASPVLINNKENTNPNSIMTRSQVNLVSDQLHPPVSESASGFSRRNSPSKSVRRLRYKNDKEIKELTRQLEVVKRVNEAYRKKLKRLTEEKKDTSLDIMNDKLLQSYTALTTHKAKQEFSTNLILNVKTTLKDKRRLGKLTKIFRRRVNVTKGLKIKKMREDVVRFLEEDENSSVTAGKKETIKKAGVIKQRRYLTDSLYHLHKKFLTKVDYKLSFTTFSRFRPFWVLFSSQKPKETCLCVTHENFGLLVEAMRKNHLIPHKNATDVLIDICCDPYNFNCLLRICKDCKGTIINNYQEFDNCIDFSYWTWVSKLEGIVQKGREKLIRVVKKEKNVTRPKDAIQTFEKQLDIFSKHCGRVAAQHDAIKRLKLNLQPEEAIIHVDFSENYKCQYAEEIQAVHFGGSRKQVTLHTSVLYFYIGDTKKTQCFATTSQNMRHDAAAVWAHIVPLLEYLKQKTSQITTLHIVSDSATSQYRNYKTFFVISALNWQNLNLTSVTWNYSESGHGKGAPDGVGGTLKRTADAMVSRGHDIPDFDTFVKELKSNVKNIVIETVSDYDIIEKDMLLPNDLRSFKGTQQVHQVIWNDSDKYQVTMRNLSCVEKACILQPRCCNHVKYLGSHVLRPEMLSNSFNPNPADAIEYPDESNFYSDVVPLQRSYAFYAPSEVYLPEELMPEITKASDVRHDCAVILPQEIMIQNCTPEDSPNLPKRAGNRIHILEDIVIFKPNRTVTVPVLDEPLPHLSPNYTGLASADSMLSSSDLPVSLTSVLAPGAGTIVQTKNSLPCLKMSDLSYATPSTSKCVSSIGKIYDYTTKINKKPKVPCVKSKGRGSSNKAQINSKDRKNSKTKSQRKYRGKTRFDEEVALPLTSESDYKSSIVDEVIETSEAEENDYSIDAEEDNVHEGDWVVVKMVSEKNLTHRYVGQVINESLASLDVKFAKKINDKRFKWPVKTDICAIGKYQVIKKLPPPYFKSSSKRIGAFEFPKSLRQLKIDL